MAYIGSDISKFNTADELTVSGDANVTGTVKPAGDTAAGDDAAIGYTAAEGLILTGQGSTSDITLKNDADATVFTVPTGTDDILFPDSAKAMFGAGSDLQIYHDGSSSFIADVGTGNLTLLANEFRLNNSGNTENMITAAPDGAVTLFHNDSAKIATSSTGATITGATVTASGGSASAPAYAVTSGSLGANGLFVPAANTLGFSAAGTERMRVDSSGKLGIGTSSPGSNLHVSADEANFIARFVNDGNNVNRLGIFVQTGTDDGSGTNVFFAAYDGDGTETGQLRSVSGTFQLTDTSDERLKQDIVDTTVSGLTSVNSMKVRDFAYKRNPTQTIKAGFVAQELQTVFSSAVSYSESDDDKILSVSRERLVPVLVKAIQELSAKNDALEARITALEDA